MEKIVKERVEEDKQPLAEDTSFPPPQPDETVIPVNIPDPWLMPRRLAEDYYAGGNIRPGPHGELNPHYLGAGDDDFSPISNALVPPLDIVKVVDDKVQPVAEDTSFPPPQPDEIPIPVNIPDPWLMPRRLAEDYYAGGDIRPGPDNHLDPHHLSGDDDDTIPTKALSPGDVEVIEEDEQQQPLAKDT